MDREAVVWNCSFVNAMKGTVLHGTVPRHRVNGKPIRTYAEQFHTEPFSCKRSLRGRLQHGGSGGSHPLPSAYGGEGGKICPFARIHLGILSVIYLQQMLL